VDVALALAVASATQGFAVPANTVALGEVGLAGELRGVSGVAQRLSEAQRLGAKTIIVPAGFEGDVAGANLRRCHSLNEAIEAARGAA
jgi:DNA repair protein RadA/Sms